MGNVIAAIFFVGVMVATAGYLVGSMLRSIQDEKKSNNIQKVWKNFGLSIAFCILFFVTWVAQGVAQWQEYTDEQLEHEESVKVGDFVANFSKSTLENWQSEFLQLFSFVVLSALLIHHGSAESKDSDDRIEEALLRIENKLGTAPHLRDPDGTSDSKDLHVLPDGFEGWMLREEGSSEPEGYYDTQQEAIAAGRQLASKNAVSLIIHGEDYKVRDEVSRS